MENEKTIRIGGEDYPEHMLNKFMKIHGANDVRDFPHGWLDQHMKTFAHGYQYGCEVTNDDAPDCGECNVHEKAAELGPPAGHYSQQDR